MEVWKDIIGYEGLYRVSNYGNIYSYKSNRNLSLNVSDDGYPQFNLCNNGDQKLVRTHIIVAQHFVDNPNPNEYDIVDHKDTNRLNCNSNNLRWTNRGGNNNNRGKNSDYPVRERIEYSEEELLTEEWVDATTIIDTLKDKDYFMVSNLGRVRYFKSNGNYKKLFTVSIKKKHSPKKYPGTSVRVNGKKYDFYIHLLVSKCFLGDTPHGMLVDHKDSDRNNPRLSNLQFLTPKENSNKGDNKNQPKGSSNVCSKLTTDDLFTIYDLFFIKGMTKKEIHGKYNVSSTTICNVLNLKSYKDEHQDWLKECRINSFGS